MTISAKVIMKTRVELRCADCKKSIPTGSMVLRCYGAAHNGDPPYAIYEHISHVLEDGTSDPKVAGALSRAAVKLLLDKSR
jgi:hypothetical protein